MPYSHKSKWAWVLLYLIWAAGILASPGHDMGYHTRQACVIMHLLCGKRRSSPVCVGNLELAGDFGSGEVSRKGWTWCKYGLSLEIKIWEPWTRVLLPYVTHPFQVVDLVTFFFYRPCPVEKASLAIFCFKASVHGNDASVKLIRCYIKLWSTLWMLLTAIEN